MIQKAASEKMIDLDAKKVVFIMKIIDLNAKVSAKKTTIVLIFEINGGGIYTAIVLINQDTIVLFQVILLLFEIRYLRISLFLLISYFANILTK